MRKSILVLAALALSGGASSYAAEGFVVGEVELRAGPDPAYPPITLLGDGTPVSIMGCVGNWSWCDVATPVDRGWVPADFLQEVYQGQRVYVPEYALIIGVPIVTFEFASYWDRHYRSRPFYVQRDRFVSVQPQLAPPRHAPRNAPANAAPNAAAGSGAPSGAAVRAPQQRTPVPAATTSATTGNPSQGERRAPPATRTPPAAPATRESSPPAATAPAQRGAQPQRAPAPAEHRSPQNQNAPAPAEPQKTAPKPQARPVQKDKETDKKDHESEKNGQ